MKPTRRAVGLGALAAAAAAASGGGRARGAATGAPAGYGVSGKNGPFVKQVAGRANLGGGGGGGGSMGLTDVVSLGRYQTARIRMPQTEAKVAALLAKLDTQWPYAKGQTLQVHILGVDYYNAYSLPDGSIVVAFGLLDQAQSDDEVAFVLAHELGHVRLGHFAPKAAAPERSRQEMASKMGALFLTSAAISAAGASGSGVLAAAAQAGATNDLIHFMSNVMIEPDHTREQEDEADCIGYDLSERASYSADSASAKVFDTIVADQQRHQQMIDTLGTQLKNQLGNALKNGSAVSMVMGGASGLRSGLMENGAQLAFNVAMAHANQPPPQHRPPAERKRGLSEYSALAYPDGAPLRDEQQSWLTAVRAAPEYVAAKEAVGAVSDAKRARSAGKYADAQAAIQKALATKFGTSPLVLNEAARLHDDMGDLPGAERFFERANASADQTVEGYVDHARMLFRVKQNDRAMAVAKAGIARFDNDDKPFIALQIAIAKQAGNQGEADGYYQQCIGYNRPGLTKDCDLAAGKKEGSGAQQTKGSSMPHIPFGIPHFP
ncbi:MAG TPA: M48 family metalloprotease [Caulobacteraceae bacterium]|jgi:putative metalloprotease